MRRHYLTYEDANNESLRLGTLIREKNQSYLDKLGKGQTDNTLKWDEPKEEYNGWSLQDHPDIQGYIKIVEKNLNIYFDNYLDAKKCIKLIQLIDPDYNSEIITHKSYWWKLWEGDNYSIKYNNCFEICKEILNVDYKIDV